ncbi:hypothetical protein PROFUN_14898 [Planoprotostelium fungivorum]|uniref:Uncharacterized protein n=1 Tax=Planoprotostelium fungivorum TaxID=1890364 RepID=A0A2P6MY84_9EUKA|nr:hypothetical protein PROFUN_14898 [Planoprotostelium fungivorum]
MTFKNSSTMLCVLTLTSDLKLRSPQQSNSVTPQRCHSTSSCPRSHPSQASTGLYGSLRLAAAERGYFG